jgi:hypothetical protein
MLGLDFVRGLSHAPPTGVPLLTHKRTTFQLQLQDLRVQLETQRDLISFNYSYSFQDEPKCRHGGAMSGFTVDGGIGSIDVRPAGYCDLTIMNVAPNGRGRIIAVMDLRVRREYDTLNKGKLRIYTRKATVGWFDELDKLISFLRQQSTDRVELIHGK